MNMLKRIVIENYRSCLRTSIDLHPHLSILIGPNGSGKTNILQAIFLLNRMARQGDYPRPRQRSISGTSLIQVVFQEGGTLAQLKASIVADTGRSNDDMRLASRQKWLLKGKRGQQGSLEFPLAAARRYTFKSLATMPGSFLLHRFMGESTMRKVHPEISVWSIRVVNRIAKFCTGIRYYGASQFTNPGFCPVSFEIDQEGRLHRLFPARGHARVLFDMYTAWKEDSSHRFQQFMDIVGPRGLRLIDGVTFREVPTSSFDYSVRVGGKVEKRRRHKLLIIPQFTVGRQKLSPNQLSEGTFKTLALLFHVMTEKSTALLIEEPEVCVHHGLLSSILDLIKSYSMQKQMVVSTHSDYVLDYVGPENVYRVAFDKSSGTTARHISKTMSAKEYSALREYLEREGNLGEYWREGGLGDRP